MKLLKDNKDLCYGIWVNQRRFFGQFDQERLGNKLLSGVKNLWRNIWGVLRYYEPYEGR